MWRQFVLAFLPLAVLLAIPVLLRPGAKQTGSGLGGAGDRVVIITPHSETIRYELGRAFREHYRKRFGREVVVEWRTPGGTSDIVRFIADRYESAFKQIWTAIPGKVWSRDIATRFCDPRTVPGSHVAPDAIAARQAFLASDAGIGLDLFFGGGQYDHHRQAEKGYAVDAGIQRLHPDWFSDGVIPQQFSGEIFYDPAGRYYGVCLSSFGLCWNRQRLAELADASDPTGWESLGESRFFGQLVIADPTKSGSVNKCYELMVQQQMAKALATGIELERGWANGMNLVKRIAANSRTVTDSASKVSHETASGVSTAGICIDFYGRSEAEWSDFQSGGAQRIQFMSPTNGTSVSADPVQLLRGAPNRAIAIAFIEFILSVEGQKLWNYRVGTPGGPVQYALRRLPIRKDLYGPAHSRYMSDAGVNLYESCAGFTYHPEWTAPYFNLLRVVIKCTALDTLPELRLAWKEIIRAGGPAAVPRAMARFNALPFGYRDLEACRQALAGPSARAVLKTQREWSESARQAYRDAAELARAGQ
jgi:ABC-type Fe3+ transport system substrate-binding protein